jgi:hypothetical protein
MHPVIEKTFGGLSKAYYFRQLFFGMILALLICWVLSHGQGSTSSRLAIYLVLLVNALLYPYSRFVYEGIVGFIMGDNVFFVNAFLMLIVKYMTMAFCFACAIFIAPIGLAYLYWHHSRRIS